MGFGQSKIEKKDDLQQDYETFIQITKGKYKYDKNYKQLGAGTYGTVILAGGVAIKISRGKDNMEWLREETENLFKLQKICKGGNLLCFDDYYEDIAKERAFLVTEYLQNYVTLFDFQYDWWEKLQNQPTIEDLKEYYHNIVPKILDGILVGLRNIHYNGLAHGDLSCNNIMVDEKSYDVKIIDFGASCFQKRCEDVPVATTYLFLAPELMGYNLSNIETDWKIQAISFWNQKYEQSHRLKKQPTLEERQKSDIWSVGVIALDLINRSSGQIFTNAIKKALDTRKDEDKDLVQKMKDSIRQFTATQKITDEFIGAVNEIMQWDWEDHSKDPENSYFIYINPERIKEIKISEVNPNKFLPCIYGLLHPEPEKRNDNFRFAKNAECVKQSIAYFSFEKKRKQNK